MLTLWALGALLLVAAGASEASLPQPPLRRVANPLLLTLAFTAIGAALPLPWRDLVMPAALNLAHLAFFASLLGRPRG